MAKSEILGYVSGNSKLRNAVYNKNKISPCLVSAMGAGGGFIPLVIEIRKLKDEDNNARADG